MEVVMNGLIMVAIKMTKLADPERAAVMLANYRATRPRRFNGSFSRNF